MICKKDPRQRYTVVMGGILKQGAAWLCKSLGLVLLVEIPMSVINRMPCP